MQLKKTMPSYYKRAKRLIRPRKAYKRVKPYVKSYLQKAQWAVRQIMWLKRLINTEIKYTDTSFNSNVDDTGSIQPITQFEGGTGEDQRVGDHIKAFKLHLRGHIRLASDDDSTSVRFIIVHDKHNNQGTDPTLAEILDSTATRSYKNRDNTYRFDYLYDRYYLLGAGSDTQINLKFNKNLYHKITWGSSTAADTRKGHLYVLMLSDETLNPPRFTWETRFRYVDN